MAIFFGTSPCDQQLSAAPSADDSASLRGLVCLAVCAGAVSDARQFVRLTLRSIEVASNVADDAELLASELVTNVVRYCAEGFEPEAILKLGRIAKCLRIEVHDSNPSVPVRRVPDADAESGRGLMVVKSLADRWGYVATSRGKYVWCELTAWPAEPTTAQTP